VRETALDELIVVIDSREQSPFFKVPPKGVMFIRDTLRYGDYSIKGFEEVFCIERKNPDDFITSVTTDGDRFKKRLEEFRGLERAIVMVEEPLASILKKCKPAGKKTRIVRTKKGRRPVKDFSIRQVHPNSIIGAVESIVGKYGVQLYFAEGKADAEERTINIIRKYHRWKRYGL